MQISVKNDDENAFGDSILDDELGDMEIKIYTQASSQSNGRESNEKSVVVLDLDAKESMLNFKNKAATIADSTGNDVVCINDEQSNLEANVLENEVK